MQLSKYARLHTFLKGLGEPSYRYSQVVDGVFRKRIRLFRGNSTLPSSLVSALESEFGEGLLNASLAEEHESGQATKALLSLGDQERVETVHMQYRAGWHSYCVSSQVGCGFKCSFCATGTIGLKRNLTADEVTDQVLYFLLQGQPIDSIAFMGMGEPLANQNTFAALTMLQDRKLFALGARRISVSTIGLPRGIERLTADFPQVNLTLSLHSPFDGQRSEIMPINRSHSLAEVLQLMDRHAALTRRKVYLAYVLLGGVNDSMEHARALVDVVLGRAPYTSLYHVNLIRYNAAKNVLDGFQSSPDDQAQAFLTTLRNANIHATIRQSFGVDIDAACGQLYGKYDARKAGHGYARWLRPEADGGSLAS
jgi:23S rRNA (adenine-C8)-methyltransferase